MARQRSLFRVWLISYVSVAIVPIVASIALAWIPVRLSRDQIDTTAEITADQVRAIVDKGLRDVIEFTRQVALDRRVVAVLAAPTMSPGLRYQRAELTRDLNAYLLANTVVDDFYIYSYADRGAIVPGAFYSRDLVLREFHANPNLQSVWWIDRRPRFAESGFFVVPANESRFSRGQIVVYVVPIPISPIESTRAVMVVVLDEEPILSEVERMSRERGHRVLLVDGAGMIVPVVGSGLPGLVEPRLLTDRLVLIDGVQYNTNRTQLTSAAWNAIVLTPVETYRAPLLRTVITIAVTLVVSLVIGIAIAYRFALTAYRPLRMLADTYGEMERAASERGFSEYDTLAVALGHLTAERKSLTSMIENQQGQLAVASLNNLLQGELSVLSGFDRIARELALPETPVGYIVMVASLQQPDSVAMRSSIRVLQNASALVGNDVPGFAVVPLLVRGWPTFVVAPSLPNDRAGIERIAHSCAEALSGLTNSECRVGVSRQHDSWEQAATALQEAIDVLALRHLSPDRVLWSSNMEAAPEDYPFGISEELRLVEALRGGDAAAASLIVRSVFESMSQRSPGDPHHVTLVLSDLLASLYKAVDTFADNVEDLRHDLDRVAQETGNASQARALEPDFNDLVRAISHRALVLGREAQHPLVRGAITEIRGNITNPELCVAYVASRLAVNADYLSRLYRRATGKRLHDTIVEERVTRAVQIATKHPEWTTSAIATDAGFTSLTTFGRAFRKVTGVSPSEFRASLHR